MEEKILIESVSGDKHKHTPKVLTICCIISVIGMIMVAFVEGQNIDSFADFFEFVCETLAFDWYDFGSTLAGIMMYLGVALFIIYLMALRFVKDSYLAVSSVGIVGTTMSGEKIKLSFGDIVQAEKSSFNGIIIKTKIRNFEFEFLKNRDEVNTVLNQLLMERRYASTSQEKAPATDNADELKKYKELLDDGVITQEEFDAKKKQLLGL